jgi:hypothetical protein
MPGGPAWTEQSRWGVGDVEWWWGGGGRQACDVKRLGGRHWLKQCCGAAGEGTAETVVGEQGELPLVQQSRSRGRGAGEVTQATCT